MIVQAWGDPLLELVSKSAFQMRRDRFLRDQAPQTFWRRVQANTTQCWVRSKRNAPAAGDLMRSHLGRLAMTYRRIDRKYPNGEELLLFQIVNRNKRSRVAGHRPPVGRKVVDDLVREGEVVYSNMRDGVPATLRLMHAHLAPISTAIVRCSVSSFGMTRLRFDQPGYDAILQGLAGWMALARESHGPPEKAGLSLIDDSGGFVAALSLLAVLHAARRTGIGLDCDVSLFDTAIGPLTYPATWHLSTGFTSARTRSSAHHPTVGAVRAPASPVKAGRTNPRPAAAREADASVILSDIRGDDEGRPRRLRDAGAFA